MLLEDFMRQATFKLINLLGCFVFLAFVTIVANAQFKASVQGTVTDNAGAIVAEATVTLTNKETNQTQQTKTSEEGFYRFSGLAPGLYTLTVEKENFKKQITEDVQVQAETLGGLNIVLQAGGIAETVTVTAENAPLETEDANIRKVISNQEILELPQVGRDPYELARLAPGVFGAGARSANGGSSNLPNTSGPGGSNLGIFSTENQVQISANGQRLSANNFQVDGVSVNSQTWGGAAVITPSQESVEEVQVTSSTYSAEDGRNSGAQIKVVTKQGTNRFSGSAFFKYNNPKWNAFNRGFTIPGTTRGVAASRVNNNDKAFGGSFGGPIVKEKLFFFFAYEGLRSNQNNTYEAFVETSQFRQLIRNVRPNSIAARILSSPGIEPRIVSILPRACADFSFPVTCQNVAGGFDLGSPISFPNRPNNQYVPFNMPLGGGLDGIADLQYALLENPANFKGNQYTTRVDYQLTEKDKIFFSGVWAPTNQFTPDTAGQSRPMNDISSNRLNWKTAFVYARNFSATILNEARFNITKWSFDEVSSNPNVNFGIPRIEIEGYLPSDRLRFGAPRSENTPGVIGERQLDFRDVLTWIRGNHSFRFGGEYRVDLNDNTGTGGARPLYSFVRPWNFANDTPIFIAINADFNGQPQANNVPFKTSEVAFFVQDDWKVRPNLTLNLGLRYGYYSPIQPRGGDLIGNLVLGSNGLADAKVVAADKLTKSDYNNFGPQVGFAWSPNMFGLENKLVIRGGFGIGYDRLPNALLANARANPPSGARYNICCGGAGAAGDEDWAPPYANGQILYALGSSSSPTSYPRNPVIGGGVNPNTGGPNVGQIEIYGADPNLKTAQVYRYSLEGQYELPLKLVATLGYQGSKSENFVRIEPLHLTQPATNSTFNPVYYGFGDVGGNYNALLARLQRRFSNGVQFDLNYRFSKSLDTYSYEAPCGCTNQTYPVDQSQEYGPSDFDVRHFTTFSAIWELPFLRDKKSWTGKLLGGWQLSGIVTQHTGFPWTVKVDRGIRGPNGNFFGPIRPIGILGGQPTNNSNSNFLRAGGIFPGGAAQYFVTTVNGDPPTYQLNPPGIGRNTFRGPRYFNIDMSLSKKFGLPSFGVLGENTNLNIRFNFFNIFNFRNLANFQSGSPGTFAFQSGQINPRFGEPDGVLAGRVVEFQARFSF